MKRILPHPARAETPTMWRSLGELENSSEFEEALGREFPRGADVYEQSGLSKREFLKLMGASMALTGVGMSGCRRPESFIVPLTEGVEWTIPGKFLYYATSMPTRLGAIPLIATTVDGRPTKLEGNPLHPYSNGATDAFAQASILDLYDPSRAKEVKRDGAVVGVDQLDAYLAEISQQGGEGLAILADGQQSPTRARLRDELLKKYPDAIWAEYEPLGASESDAATESGFGENVRLVPSFAEADVILALDSDFLNVSNVGPAYAKDFYSRRHPDGEKMNRLYIVENHYSNTGGLADHRLRLKASDIGAFAAALAARVGAGGGERFGEASVALNVEWLDGVAQDLLAHQGRCLVLVGSHQPAAVQALGLAINQALGNVGTTVKGIQTPAKKVATISDLSAAIRATKVRTLVILGGNPVYDAPADLGFEQLITQVPSTLHLSPFDDETSLACEWSVPAAHYLEAWGDAWTFDGTHTSVQPMIMPLWNGVSQLELLAQLLGQAKPVGPDLIRKTFEEKSGATGEALEMAWNEFLRAGFVAETQFADAALSFNAGGAGSIPFAPADAADMEVVFLQSSSVDDGRYANNSWLQETPDFESKLTWDNAALVSPKTARELGLKDGSLVEITAAGQTITAATLIAPGNADRSLSIALGYGRTNVSHLMEGVGFNAYPLRTSGGLRFQPVSSVKPVGGELYKFARPQEARVMEGRDLFREGTLERYEADPDFAKTIGMDSHIPEEHSIYKNPYFEGEGRPLEPQQWAMTVDLNVCDGCNACVVACQAENNVPVVGKDQVIKGRDMAWIRIDRYFANPLDLKDKKGELADDPEMLAEAIMCQHCENAPCETVCPVNATVHSEDGLNLMTYNRCIGTRYCANNCPWKVRRFNFFDYNERPIDELYWGPLAEEGMAESLKMSKNPNVTVRMRGVMEKCTFCIQRIEEAKIARLVKAGASNKYDTPIPPVRTACQAACPSEAIVFGDMNDPTQKIHETRQDPRGFEMLKYLNVRPRVTYLARIKNPNMAMPGAELVGNINSPDYHAKHADHGDQALPTGATHGAAGGVKIAPHSEPEGVAPATH
jgi:molybdopterin-containing oxidoreductase family iron-sulfur binding subunit